MRRLRTALALPGARNHFFMMTALGTPDDTLADIADLLAARGAGNRLTFIRILPGHAVPAAIDEPELRPNLRRVSLQSPSESVGLRFADAAADDFLARLVRQDAARAAQS